MTGFAALLTDLWGHSGYRVLLILISVEVGVIGAMLGTLSWQTMRREREEKRRRQLVRLLEEGDEEELRKRLGGEATRSRALRKALVELGQSGHREMAQRLWDEFGFGEQARDALRSESARRRMEAIRRLYLFANEEDCQAIADAVGREEDHRFRILAAHILARHEGRGADVGRALEGVFIERRIMEQPFYSIFRELPEAELQKLVAKDQSGWCDRVRAVLLEVAVQRGIEGVGERVKELASEEEMERRIGAARIAASLGGESGRAILRVLLDDACWQVRAHAAHGLGVIGNRDDVEKLKQACSDEEFWVRENAHWAMAELGAELDYFLEPMEEGGEREDGQGREAVPGRDASMQMVEDVATQ